MCRYVHLIVGVTGAINLHCVHVGQLVCFTLYDHCM